jgi:hypothetical protein
MTAATWSLMKLAPAKREEAAAEAAEITAAVAETAGDCSVIGRKLKE